MFALLPGRARMRHEGEDDPRGKREPRGHLVGNAWNERLHVRCDTCRGQRSLLERNLGSPMSGDDEERRHAEGDVIGRVSGTEQEVWREQHFLPHPCSAAGRPPGGLYFQHPAVRARNQRHSTPRRRSGDTPRKCTHGERPGSLRLRRRRYPHPAVACRPRPARGPHRVANAVVDVTALLVDGRRPDTVTHTHSRCRSNRLRRP